MKLFFFILFLGPLLITGAFSQEETNTDVKHWTSHQMMKAILKNRCTQYLAWDYKAIYQCYRTANALTKKLDYYHPEIDSLNGVFFVNELTTLWRNPKVQNYLLELRENLELLQRQLLKNFDLYQFTLEYFGNKQKAVEILAVMFQDTSGLMAPLTYLEFFGIEGDYDNYSQVLTLLQTDKLAEFRNKLKIYPEDSKLNIESAGPTLYYFYINAHLSYLIKDFAFAKLLPATLSALYKIEKISGNWAWFIDPTQIDYEENKYRVNAVYTAYYASHWISAELTSIEPMKIFTKKFSKSPRGYMSQLFTQLWDNQRKALDQNHS